MKKTTKRSKGEVEDPAYAKKALVRRVTALYPKEHKWRLGVASLGAVLGGVATSFMGPLVTWASFPFRDQPDPDKLQAQHVLHGPEPSGQNPACRTILVASGDAGARVLQL